MKVLLLNGSPHEKGCTYTALEVIAKTFEEKNIQSEIFYIGCEPISPCKSCFACAKLGKCVVDDKVNKFVNIMSECDGLIIGSPVHYASASGIITTFLDRAFFAGSRSKVSIFAHKPGAAIASARRAGTTATLDQLNKYFSITQMPIISGRYWNMVHGSTPEDVMQDKEGVQNLQILARNMAWFLKCKECALQSGIQPPKTKEPIIHTNFIR